MFNLEITAPALEILENQAPQGLLKRIIRKILRFLQRYFGAEILIKIPARLQELTPQILKAIKIASKLQSLGIVKKIIKRPKYPDEPFFYNYFIPSAGRAYGAGVDFLSEEKAFWKSLAEVTERYLWFNSDRFFQNAIKSPYKKIKKQALDIFSLAGFSKNQKNRFPILQFDENTEFNWITAYSLTKERKIFCPVQLISSLYFQQNVKTLQSQKRAESMLRWCITTGLATGRSLEEAIVKGILEVIERDAFMVAYLNKLSLPIFDLEYLSVQDEEIAKIIKNFERYKLEVYIIQLPTEFPVFANAALIIDRTGLGPALSVGASADFDFKTSILNALSESLIVRYSLKKKFLKPIEADKINREERLIYWAKLKNLSKIEFFLKGDKIKFDLEQRLYKTSDNRKFYKNKLDFLVQELKKRYYEACFVELTNKDVKKLGLSCIQAVIPQLQPMHLSESIPYFGGKRLKEESLLNKEPHPFP